MRVMLLSSRLEELASTTSSSMSVHSCASSLNIEAYWECESIAGEHVLQEPRKTSLHRASVVVDFMSFGVGASLECMIERICVPIVS